MAIHNKHLTLGPTGIQASFSNANQKKKKKSYYYFMKMVVKEDMLWRYFSCNLYYFNISRILLTPR